MNGQTSEKMNAKPWKKGKLPRRMLIIRLQAIGDVVLTFPLIQALKNEYPEMDIDFLTRNIQGELSKKLSAIQQVICITNSQRTWRQVLHLVRYIPYFFSRRYDVILDLQRTKSSRLIPYLLQPAAWAEFDRAGFAPATERYRKAVEATGLSIGNTHPFIQLEKANTSHLLLLENGWNGQSDIVVLNPAGFFKSRNWPIENYVAFAQQWQIISANTQFLILGDERIASKTNILQEKLGDKLINMQNKTTLSEAFQIISKAHFMLSEDSGLLWMAWVQKVPCIAMYGSTPGVRMNMGGTHARFLTSSDLPCGDCFLPDCKFGETALCLSRYSPEAMIALAQTMPGTALYQQPIH